jgi:uncharacterized caspase-like protein
MKMETHPSSIARNLPANRWTIAAWRAIMPFVVMLAVAVLSVVTSDPALAGRRVALIIGNTSYDHAGRLPNTTSDAQAMAALFKKVGFDAVVLRVDLGEREFKRTVRGFMGETNDADIAVIYYAGHGIEVSGKNYLIPVDAKLATEYDVDDETVSLDRMIQALQPAKQLRLIILDACRENPFLKRIHRAVASRDVTVGLGKVDPAETDNTVIAFAAKAGSASLDGTGPNSPFATALLKYITQPGIDIRIALGNVRDEVLRLTKNEQEPFVYSSLGGNNVSLVPAPEKKTPDTDASIQHDYELAERVGTRQAWEYFLAAHDRGFYADLARAQLAKLTPPNEAQPPQPKQTDVHLTPERQNELQRPKIEPPSREERPKIEPPSREETCRHEADQLRRLRSNPNAADIDKFARELTCEELRPQVARLVESIAPLQAVPPEPVVRQNPPPEEKIATPPRLTNPDVERKPDMNSCKRDEDRLAKLRANPVREDVQRFAHELQCDSLRAQVTRLLESVGN